MTARRIRPWLVPLILWAACHARPETPTRDAAPTTPPVAQRVAGDEVKRVIPLDGFDPDGEPELRELRDGSLRLVFNFMPPSWADGEEKAWASFDQEIARELGVAVVREDRELMLIAHPRADTAPRLQRFLATRGRSARPR